MLKTQTPRVMSGSCAENLRHINVTQKTTKKTKQNKQTVRMGSGLLC